MVPGEGQSGKQHDLDREATQMNVENLGRENRIECNSIRPGRQKDESRKADLYAPTENTAQYGISK